jgi:hypothetical protein
MPEKALACGSTGADNIQICLPEILRPAPLRLWRLVTRMLGLGHQGVMACYSLTARF